MIILHHITGSTAWQNVNSHLKSNLIEEPDRLHLTALGLPADPFLTHLRIMRSSGNRHGRRPARIRRDFAYGRHIPCRRSADGEPPGAPRLNNAAAISPGLMDIHLITAGAAAVSRIRDLFGRLL